MDGVNEAERQSYMTFWAINSAPLFAGDDLTKLDAYGLKLLTNREVIAIDQAGVPARPLNQDQLQQTWYAKNTDGSVTVGLFNLADTPATVTGKFDQLGITGKAKVRDVWAGKNTSNVSGQVSAELPAHGSKLYKIYPNSLGSVSKPANFKATDVSRTTVSLNWRPSTGATSYKVYANGKQVATSTSTSVVVTGLLPQTQYKFEVKGVNGGKYVRGQCADHHADGEVGWSVSVRGRGVDQHADRQRERQRLHAVLGRQEDRQHRV